MCTVTLSYNEKNAQACSQLAALLSSGLFTQLQDNDTHYQEQLRRHRAERDAFMAASKRNMSHLIARHV